jgi:O-antigen/teichoic acid export membrane protein
MRIKDHIHKITPFIELISKGMSFIAVLIITRLLTVEEFGSYYYVVSLVAWISVFMDGGISYFIINKSVKGNLENLGDYFVDRIIFSLGTIGVLLIFSFFLNINNIVLISLYAVTFLFLLLISLFKVVSRIEGQYIIDNVAVIIEPSIRILILLCVFFLVEEITITMLFMVLLTSSLLGLFITYAFFIKKNILEFNWSGILKRLAHTFNETKYYLLMYLFLVGIKRIEIIILEYKFDKNTVGLFSSADNFYSAFYLFFTSLILVSIKGALSKEKNNLFLTKLFFIGLTIVSVVLIIFLSDFLYLFFYTKDYSGGSSILNVLAFSIIANAISYYFILKNNKNNMVKKNLLILFAAFSLKVFILTMINFNSVLEYGYSIVMVDYITMLLFVILQKFSADYLYVNEQ